MATFHLERQVTKAWDKLLDDAEACRDLYLQAGKPVPARLRRFLSDDDAGLETETKIVVPPPVMPPRPSVAAQDWIWLDHVNLTPATAVRTVLQAATEPMPVREVIEAVHRLGVEASEGTVANIGTRLHNLGQIVRSELGWKAQALGEVPVLYKGNAWGAPGTFDKTEVASYRRACLLHVFALSSDGLQPMQLLKTMETCDWFKVPLNKDILKLDLENMIEDGAIKRIGATGKYTRKEAAV
jgi:hypothetical protein